MTDDPHQLHAMCGECATIRGLTMVDRSEWERTCCYCGRTTHRIVSTFVDDPEYLTCDHGEVAT